MFDPKVHLIQLPRRVKDPSTGHFTTRLDEYLEVKWRLVWFRKKSPHGHIETEFLRLDWEQGIAICKCIVTDGEGGCAHGTGTETRKGFEGFVEKAETRAIGWALAVLDIGTQFVSEELSEGEHVADAPVSPAASTQKTTTTPSATAPAMPTAATNGQTPPPPDAGLEHPTEGHLAALKNLAVTACGDPVEVFEGRIRQMMKLPKQASVSPRLLSRSMSMTTYMECFAYYTNLKKQLARKTEVSHGAPSTQATASQPTPAPTEESPRVDPALAESSSAPGTDATDAAERDRVRLRQEVAAWPLRVSPAEIELIITHHPYSKARGLLWQARTVTPAAMPMEAAAAD
jgi:hypothetical protein